MDIPVYVTSDLTSSERKISPQWTILYLKQRLEQITGISPQFQTIQLYVISNSNDYREVSNDNVETNTVAGLNIPEYCRIHVIDENPDSTLKDLAEIMPHQDGQSYQISEEDYANRQGTVLQWKKQEQLGRFDPEYQLEKQRELQKSLEATKTMNQGDRCRIINIGGERRGTIKYVGKVDVLDNGEDIWVGIEFDEPVGKNDGSINGMRLFSCRPKHGSIVKPNKVDVGDYPELDPFEDEL